ncbi:MAG: ribonucleotide reductase N-terminal alpha domain-containing protein [Actinomycetota bacterium]
MKVSDNAMAVLKKRYLLKNESGRVAETPDEMLKRVARAVSEPEEDYAGTAGRAHWEQEFYHLMADGLFLPNSPTLMNAGTPVGQLAACFVVPVGDSIAEIFEALKDMAIIHQSGGGTGFSFSSLRPDGDMVKSTRGVASGPLSFIKVFDTATDVIKQGGRRRGANMGILRVDHPDIVDFIKAKKEPGVLENFNLSVAVTDAFLEAVKHDGKFELINPRTGRKKKTVEARKLFDLIVETAWATGDPGLIFIDEMNRHNPTPALGNFASTNPCVSGDALVATDRGLLRMDDIAESRAGGRLSVITDDRVSSESRTSENSTTVMVRTRAVPKTGVSVNPVAAAWLTGIRQTIRVVTKCGYEIDVTPDHRIMTTDGWKAAGDLIPEKDRVLIQSSRGGFGQSCSLPFLVERKTRGRNGRTYTNNLPYVWSQELGWTLGWLTGDGWLRAGDKDCRVGFVFGSKDKRVLDLLRPILNDWYGKDIRAIARNDSTVHLSYHSRMFVEFFQQLGIKNVKSRDKRVPDALFAAPEQAVIGFLQALFTADGTIGIQQKNQTTYIRLTSVSEYLLKDVQKLLLYLGIKCKIYDRARKMTSTFTYVNKKGDVKSYQGSSQLYELQISRNNLPVFLKEIGFLGGRHADKVERLAQKTYYSDKFEDVVDDVFLSKSQAVYDLTEPITHSFIANGFVVSNCGEQPLLPYESCNLGSLKLTSFIDQGVLDSDRLREAVFTAVRFLDDVIDVNRFPLPAIEEITRNGNRKIGLGVMGLAEAFIELGLAYGSPESLDFAGHTMHYIQKTAWEASAELAEQRGSFPNFAGSVWEKRGYERFRNATVTTIAPTGTISLIAGTSSGIEPYFALSYTRRALDGALLPEYNAQFVKAAEKRGFLTDEIKAAVAAYGSLKTIEGVPDDVKRLFVTALDLEPDVHVRMQAAFQLHTDNAVSKTVNLPEDAGVDDVRRVYLLAHELKCKGITIYRYGTKKQQVLVLGPDFDSPEDCRSHYCPA